MFVERPNEAGDVRRARMMRENEQANEHIKKMDTDTAITQAERVALCQIDNVHQKRPLDYAAIIKYRAERPELFLTLPSDAQCRVAMALEQPQPLEDEPDAPEPEPEKEDKPVPNVVKRETLKLKKTGG